MKLVIDTNVVLDLFVFRDKAVASLHAALARQEAQWFATPSMRAELACVLSYEQIGARMTLMQVLPQQVLDAFDGHVRIVDAPPPSRILCRDADDQKFIDLAIAQRAMLLSKDKQVLALRRKLAALDVAVAATL
jgi:putative PIN family toxin of toxin-antitoxin system